MPPGRGSGMSALLASPVVVDLILALLALESALLIYWHRRTGRGIRPGQLLPNVLAGACLLLALRAALSGANPLYVGLALSGALLAHVADLYLRWRPSLDGPER